MNASSDIGYHAQRHARWHYGEAIFWVAVLACGFLFPSRYLIMPVPGFSSTSTGMR